MSGYVWRGRLCCLLLFCMLLVACGPGRMEHAIVGTWTSDKSPLIFEFREDGTYTIEAPADPLYKSMAGKYRVLGYSDTLEDAQFTLKGGLDIRFTYEGDAFFIYIDGVQSSELFRRADG
jgi:hypothetical protein